MQIEIAQQAASFIAGKAPGSFSLLNSNEEYHADRGSVSSSWIKRINRSPAHLRAYLDEPHESTKAMDLGTALHCAVLEPEEFLNRYAIYRGNGTRSSKEYKEFAEGVQQGKEILIGSDADLVEGMRKAIMAYPMSDLRAMFAAATKERSIYWTDEETGVQCRIRPDAYSMPLTLDLKKTTDARPEAFSKAIYNYGYDIQAAYYNEGLLNYTGEPAEIFIFVAVEEGRPHGVWLHEADEDMLKRGREKFRAGLRMYKKCITENQWPCYPNPYGKIDVPHWARNSHQ